MNIEELIADQEALRLVAHWKSRYLQAEDRNRDLDEKCRVLVVQLNALKQQLQQQQSSASLPVPKSSSSSLNHHHHNDNDDDAVDVDPIVHSSKSPPNSAAIIARLRLGVEHEFKQKLAAIEADAAKNAALVAQQQRDAVVLAQDRELLRSQVAELSAQKQLLSDENVTLKRSVADMQNALLQMSQQVESLAAATVQ